MLVAERKSLYRFIGIYIISTMFLVVVAVLFYYHHEMSNLENRQKDMMNSWSKEFVDKLRFAHQNSGDEVEYPNDKKFQSAIYDNKKNLIYATFKAPKLSKSDKTFWINSDKSYFVTTVSPHFLGTAFLILESKIDTTPIYELQKQIIYFFIASFLIILFASYLLGRLFMRPLKDAYTVLDDFIKDTTHELNTPIHTILSNIELVEDTPKSKEIQTSFDRIEIASKTLNGIYKDLVFLKLYKDVITTSDYIDIGDIVFERTEYFKLSIKSKRLKLVNNISASVECKIDKYHFTRMFDNLLSNAIKYNKLDGNIDIVCSKGYISIENDGAGISEKDIKYAMDRFKRFDKSVGGFGIGLSVVAKIVKIYSLDFSINSTENKTTKVEIRW
jgi:two-component system OmpR family sensor kinase